MPILTNLIADSVWPTCLENRTVRTRLCFSSNGSPGYDAAAFEYRRIL